MKGFTLTESLLALLVFSLGTIAVTHAFNSGLIAARGGDQAQRALQIAESRMDELKGIRFDQLTSSGPAPDAYFTEFTVQVTVSGGDPKNVRVDVRYQQEPQPIVSLSTLRTV